MKHPKFFRSLFNLTEDDKTIPTDSELDEKIKLLGFYMHCVYPLMWHIIKRKIWFGFRYKWKTKIKNLIIISLIGVSSYYGWVKVAKPMIIVKEKLEIIGEIKEDLSKHPVPEENLLFMNTVMILESGGDYKISKGQYWGAFQIGAPGREEAGVSCMDQETFLNDKDIQNWTMNRLMHKNYEYLKPIIKKFKIPKRGGIRIYNHIVTQSGLLAAAHLVGAFAVIGYFENGGEVPKDGNGVPLSKYFELNNYDLVFE